jgi:hypothetical protein
LRHDLPKFRLMDCDISAGLSFLSKRFFLLEQPFGSQQRHPSAPIAFQARPYADEAFRQPASAGPSALRYSSLVALPYIAPLLRPKLVMIAGVGALLHCENGNI